MLRQKFISSIKRHFKIHKVCALLGPRQCGKTTLAMQFAKLEGIPEANIFDLDNPLHIERLKEPIIAFNSLKGIIIIDEIQHIPNLFSIIRTLVDKRDIKSLKLKETSDILKKLGTKKGKRFLIGFAAESGKNVKRAGEEAPKIL